VQEEDRRHPGPGLGYVHPQARRERDERMGHARELRHLGRLHAARRRGRAGRVRSIGHDTLVLHSHRPIHDPRPGAGPWFIMDRPPRRVPSGTFVTHAASRLSVSPLIAAKRVESFSIRCSGLIRLVWLWVWRPFDHHFGSSQGRAGSSARTPWPSCFRFCVSRFGGRRLVIWCRETSRCCARRQRVMAAARRNR
jgi:hypothetical protein